jgi:guanylate kinase
MTRGRLVVISAPSGAGKSTIARAILQAHPTLRFSISATTRPVREGEREGREYYFLTADEFRRRINAEEFVEWEEIYGNYYGTLKQEVDRVLEGGGHILFDIDVKGGLSIRMRYPDALLIFIRPPNLAILQERLRNRNTESEASVARRMARVPLEMQLGETFDHQVVNDDLHRATAEVDTIVTRYLQVN